LKLHRRGRLEENASVSENEALRERARGGASVKRNVKHIHSKLEAAGDADLERRVHFAKTTHRIQLNLPEHGAIFRAHRSGDVKKTLLRTRHCG